MAKRTMAMALALMTGLACASSDSNPAESAEAPVRIPTAQRARNAAPEQPITVASLSQGGVLAPGFARSPVATNAAPSAGTQAALPTPRPEAQDGRLPASLLARLAGDPLANPGMLELSGGPTTGGVPISITSDTSLLGSEFDFPEPSLAPAPPASPVFD